MNESPPLVTIAELQALADAPTTPEAKAYAALAAAIAAMDSVPCAGDARFTADLGELHPREVAQLAVDVCGGCAALAECRRYGERAQPPAGIWGGRTYRRRDRA